MNKESISGWGFSNRGIVNTMDNIVEEIKLPFGLRVDNESVTNAWGTEKDFNLRNLSPVERTVQRLAQKISLDDKDLTSMFSNKNGLFNKNLIDRNGAGEDLTFWTKNGGNKLDKFTESFSYGKKDIYGRCSQMLLSDDKANSAIEKLKKLETPKVDEYISALVKGLAEMEAVMPLMGQIYPKTEMEALEIQKNTMAQILSMVEAGEIDPQEIKQINEFKITLPNTNVQNVVTLLLLSSYVLTACGVSPVEAQSPLPDIATRIMHATESAVAPSPTVHATEMLPTKEPIKIPTEISVPTETKVTFPKPSIGDEVIKIVDVEKLSAIEIKSLADWDNYYKNVLGPAEDEWLKNNPNVWQVYYGPMTVSGMDGIPENFLQFEIDNFFDGTSKQQMMCSLTKIRTDGKEDQYVMCLGLKVPVQEKNAAGKMVYVKDAAGNKVYKYVKIHPVISPTDLLVYEKTLYGEKGVYGNNPVKMEELRVSRDINTLIDNLSNGDKIALYIYMFKDLYNPVNSFTTSNTLNGLDEVVVNDWVKGGYSNVFDPLMTKDITDEEIKEINGRLIKSIPFFHNWTLAEIKK